MGIQSQLGSRFVPGDRVKPVDVDAARKHGRASLHRPARDLGRQRLGHHRRQVVAAQRRQRDGPRSWVREIGAVQRHRTPPTVSGERRPSRESEVSVHHVEPVVPVATTELGCRVRICGRPSRLERKRLDVNVGDAP